MKKKGFGIIEGAIAFTLLAFIFGTAKAIIKYESYPTRLVNDCCN